MARRHSSFLLRCWDLGGDDERIEIEHVQTGTKTLARSVGAAVEWICASDQRAAAPSLGEERVVDDRKGVMAKDDTDCRSPT